MAPAQEGLDIIPPGGTGSITTAFLDDKGGIYFGGDMVAPVDSQPKEYFWLHSWIYLVPFPAPVVDSTFTYSFRVPVEVATVIGKGVISFCSFVSVGETPNFVGQEVVVNKVDSWPIVAPLTGPDVEALGQSDVQRSFVVGRGHVPAVALALGVMVAIESGAEVQFQDDVSFIFPFAVVQGLPAYGVVNFRYDPLPPVLQQ